MTSICSGVVGVATGWVERNAPYAISAMANLTYNAVRVGCNLSRKLAMAADDLINTTMGKIGTRFNHI